MRITNETHDAVYLRVDGDKFEIDMPALCDVHMRQGNIEIRKITMEKRQECPKKNTGVKA